MPSILLALLLFATSETVEAPLRGRLCIEGAKCVETTATTIAVKPADRQRRFFWINVDAKTAYLGLIAAKTEAVVLDPNAYVAIDTTLEGDRTRGWPGEVSMTLGIHSRDQWSWTLSPDEVKRLRRLYVPGGTYQVTGTTEHHHVARARVVANGNAARADAAKKDEPVKLEPVKLELRFVPLPMVRGVVVDAKDKTIADAAIAFADGTLCTTANDQGEFACELPQQFTDALVVSKSGYASSEVPITREILAGNGAPVRVVLSEGRLLTVTVVRPDATPARVTLLLEAPRLERSKVKTIPIAKSEETVRFDAGDGRYVVLVEGEGPLERLEVPVAIKGADEEKEIRIEPFELIGSATFGDQAMKEGEVEVIVPRESGRRIPLPIRAGAFQATMWQKGVLHAWVKAAELEGGQSATSPELGENPSRWDIRIANRMIAGRVFDAATKRPIPDAEMEFVTTFTNGGGQGSVPIGADGSYHVAANQPGMYSLRVMSPRHIAQTFDIRVTDEDRSSTHDFALESGVMQPIDVVNAVGAPIPKVLVVEGRVDPEYVARADERGHYELHGLPGTSRLLYFMSPTEASLVVARVRLPASNTNVAPLQVVAGSPCCSLRVSSDADASGLLLRYNGEFVPDAIWRYLSGGYMGGGSEMLLRRMPAGMYEVWAITGPEDEQNLIASNGTAREPARVGLSSGEHAVTVRVRH